MVIMDVLAQLEGPEYEQPAPPEAQESPEEIPSPEEGTKEAEGEAPEEKADLPAPLPPAPEQPPEEKRPKRLRPEAVMGIVAALAVVLLIAVVILCLPYFSPEPADEDPQALPQYHQENFEALQVTEQPTEEPQEATEETEPRETTIPPDPNPYDRNDFQYNRHNYLLLQNVESYAGVDVSAYQGDIDWDKVKASGIDFAMIRLGYRGYESGKLVKDEYAEKNLEGARAAGLRVGAYFFSQALTINEVDQEIEFILKVLDDFSLDMPVVLDWEIPAPTARTANMDGQTLTDIQLHFCGQMRDRGFQPMIYFNWHQSEHLYNLHALEAYPFWLALYQDRMEYPWKVEMWQYTSSGKVPGIAGAVDLNVYMPN